MWIVTGLILVVFAFGLLKPGLFLVALAVIACLVAFPLLLSAEKIICLVTFYIIAFGIPLFKGNLYPVAVNYIVIDAAMMVLLVFLLYEKVMQSQEPGQHYFSRYVGLFLGVVGLSLVLGIYYSNNMQRVQSEFRTLSYYAVYFVAVRHFKDMKWIKIFTLTVLVATLLASFDAIFTFWASSHIRFVSRQVHMFLLVTPFLITFIIHDKSSIRKLFYAGALFPITLSIVVSQTRGTWVATAIAVFLALILSAWAKFRGTKRIAVTAASLLLFATIGFISLKIIAGSSAQKASFIEERAATIANIGGDHSLLMRANAYLTIIGKIVQHPWLGNGLGDTATYKFFGKYSTQSNVDSTYLTVLWKSGLLGMIVFMLLYLLLIRKSYTIYRQAQSAWIRAAAIGTIAAFCGLFTLGAISPMLIAYRFNFLFGTIIAIIDNLNATPELRSSQESNSMQ